MFCKHLLNGFRDELSIFRVYQSYNTLPPLGRVARIKAMNPEQLGRPIVDPAALKAQLPICARRCPSARVGLCLFPVINVDVDADPIQ